MGEWAFSKDHEYRRGKAVRANQTFTAVGKTGYRCTYENLYFISICFVSCKE